MDRTFTADRGDAGHRIDHVLLRRLTDIPRLSRTRIQAWIDAGCVLVAGRPAGKSSARVPPGATVLVRMPEAPRARRTPAAEAVPLDILFEDEHLLLVNKPAGLVSHPSYRHPSGTLLNGLLWHARGWPPGTRPSLVQRLDRDTSGVLLVARTRAVHAAVQRAMQDGRVEKTYLAIVHGRPAPARGRLDAALGRDLSDRRRVVTSATGRPSLTFYERVATAGRGAAAVSLVRCRLGTGRMHQIRVHLAASGWPLVGDATYGPPAHATVRGRAWGLARHALHAQSLALAHPVSGVPIVVEAPLPEDLRAFLLAHGLVERPAAPTRRARRAVR